MRYFLTVCFRIHVKSLKKSTGKQRREDRINALRERLVAKHDNWLNGRISRMHAFQIHPRLVINNASRRGITQVEDRVLLLPSSLGHESIKASALPALQELAALEGNLRKAQAYEEILKVREAVKDFDSAVREKRKNARRQEPNAVANECIDELRRIRDEHIDAYNSARQALISLGIIKTNTAPTVEISTSTNDMYFPSLSVNDCFRETKRSVGDSRRIEHFSGLEGVAEITNETSSNSDPEVTADELDYARITPESPSKPYQGTQQSARASRLGGELLGI